MYWLKYGTLEGSPDEASVPLLITEAFTTYSYNYQLNLQRFSPLRAKIQWSRSGGHYPCDTNSSKVSKSCTENSSIALHINSNSGGPVVERLVQPTQKVHDV